VQTAKGGNFLLNVGPNGDGEIIDAQARPLLEAGRWLKVNGKAIYDTVSGVHHTRG
jgi:alpha-L-fucosidase